MTGPHFFSLVATENAFCGAHIQIAARCNGLRLLPARGGLDTLAANRRNLQTYSDTVMDGSTMNALVLPALRLLSVASAIPIARMYLETPVVSDLA